MDGLRFGGVGSIPAWAGETAYLAIVNFVRRVYPRVGGGNHLYR